MGNDVHATSESAGAGPLASSAGWAADLGCPGCGYNLRGLPYVAAGDAPRVEAGGQIETHTQSSAPPSAAPAQAVSKPTNIPGDVPGAGSGLLVDCPECGLRSDLGVLAQRRWDKPWHKAPGFNWMTLPVAWVVLGSVVGLMVFGAMVRALGLSGTGVWGMSLLVAFALLAGWVAMLVWVWFRCGGTVGVLFALLAHVVFGGYVAGLVLVVWGVIAGVMAVTDRTNNAGVGGSLVELAISAAMLAAGVTLFVVGRICEKQVAGHCIRLHLQRRTTS